MSILYKFLSSGIEPIGFRQLCTVLLRLADIKYLKSLSLKISDLDRSDLIHPSLKHSDDLRSALARLDLDLSVVLCSNLKLSNILRSDLTSSHLTPSDSSLLDALRSDSLFLDALRSDSSSLDHKLSDILRSDILRYVCFTIIYGIQYGDKHVEQKVTMSLTEYAIRYNRHTTFGLLVKYNAVCNDIPIQNLLDEISNDTSAPKKPVILGSVHSLYRKYLEKHPEQIIRDTDYTKIIEDYSSHPKYIQMIQKILKATDKK